MHLHIGSDYLAPTQWVNFEASPALFLQRIPFIGNKFDRPSEGKFPKNVQYGNIIKGLKNVTSNSCDGIYCSHVLEHLTLNEFHKSIKNIHSYLKPGGTFRLIVPDLEWAARNYLLRLDNGDYTASYDFCGDYTYFGYYDRPKGFKGLLKSFLGTSKHQWMWDFASMKYELENTGFINIRKCEFNDSSDSLFKLVEKPGRFIEDKKGITPALAVAIECSK